MKDHLITPNVAAYAKQEEQARKITVEFDDTRRREPRETWFYVANIQASLLNMRDL